MLPNLVIIGAQKSGTTSLHRYLSFHPDIYMTTRKELRFFSHEENWAKGQQWYESHFNTSSIIRGESSPSYTHYPYYTNVAARMHRLLPDAKLIYCVRDPIDRVISNYIHSYSTGAQNRSFSEVMTNLDNSYIDRSKYYMQLQQYLNYYPASHIKVVPLEQLSNDRRTTLRAIFEFLGVDSSYTDSRFDQVFNNSKERRRSLVKSALVKLGVRGIHRIESRMPWLVGAPIKRPEISDSLRQSLVEIFKEDVDGLRQFTGYKLDSWSV